MYRKLLVITNQPGQLDFIEETDMKTLITAWKHGVAGVVVVAGLLWGAGAVNASSVFPSSSNETASAWYAADVDRPATRTVGATPTSGPERLGEFNRSEALDRQVRTPSAANETGPENVPTR